MKPLLEQSVTDVQRAIDLLWSVLRAEVERENTSAVFTLAIKIEELPCPRNRGWFWNGPHAMRAILRPDVGVWGFPGVIGWQCTRSVRVLPTGQVV